MTRIFNKLISFAKVYQIVINNNKKNLPKSRTINLILSTIKIQSISISTRGLKAIYNIEARKSF